MQKLSGKTALITGGTGGIGLASAQLFQQAGARVAVTGRGLAGIAQAQAKLGEDALVLASDAGDMAAIDTLMHRVREHFGQLDVLFLNAAGAKAGALEQVSESDFDDLMSVNLKGVFFTLQKALPLLTPGASVIITTSISNRFGTPNASVYAASKGALRSLTQALALELIGRGIRVNAISPGPIDTPMFERMGLSEAVLEQRKTVLREKSPSRRFGTPDEIAKAALFLASEDSSYIVGAEIVVDGGMSIQRPTGP